MKNLRNRKAAMELTMGTMVTMVLLVAVLILGGYLVNRIFFGATESIDQINTQVRSEITKLFSEDSTRKIIIYPQSRTVPLKKGSQGNGFAFSIRNVETTAGEFTYVVSASETDCQALTIAQADTFIGLGKTDTITIGPGDVMDDPVLVTFNIPETAPPCSVRYNIDLTRNGQVYGSTVGVNVIIESN
jgi:hypothetical protein